MFYAESSHQGYLQGPDAMCCIAMMGPIMSAVHRFDRCVEAMGEMERHIPASFAGEE